MKEKIIYTCSVQMQFFPNIFDVWFVELRDTEPMHSDS